MGCSAALGFLGHVSIHSLRHSDLHGHPTAQFCARACSRPCVRRPVSLAGAGGAGGAALRSRCGLYSGFMSAGSIGLRGHMPCPGHHDLVLRLRHPSTAAFTFCAAALRILHPRPAPRSPCACPTSPPRAPPPMQTPPPCARQGRGPAGWGVPRGRGRGRRVQGHRELLQGAHPVPRSALLQSESETHGSVRSAPTSRRIDLKAPPTENCRPVRAK